MINRNRNRSPRRGPLLRLPNVSWFTNFCLFLRIQLVFCLLLILFEFYSFVYLTPLLLIFLLPLPVITHYYFYVIYEKLTNMRTPISPSDVLGVRVRNVMFKT